LEFFISCTTPSSSSVIGRTGLKISFGEEAWADLLVETIEQR
jgi:hypothetical protein